MIRKFIYLFLCINIHLLLSQQGFVVEYEEVFNAGGSSDVYSGYLVSNGAESLFFMPHPNQKFEISNGGFTKGFDVRSMVSQFVVFTEPELEDSRLLFNPKKIFMDPAPAIQWQIISEFGDIAGYKVQKAKGDFRGRTYEVWFAPELPVSAGPWKLRGLPGVVLEAWDAKGFITWKFKRILLSGGVADQLMAVFDDFRKEKSNYSTLSFRDAVKKENRFLEQLTQKNLAALPKGTIVLQVDQYREGQLERKFEWEDSKTSRP